MVDGLTYQPGELGAFCPTASHSTLRHLRLSGLSCFEPPNLDVLQHKWPDAPKQADILAHPCTELHWQCKQWCEQEGCTSAWGDKLLPQPAPPLSLPCTCNLPHGDSSSGVYDPTWYEKAAALPDGHNQ